MAVGLAAGEFDPQAITASVVKAKTASFQRGVNLIAENMFITLSP